MRSRTLTTLGASVAALVLAATLGPGASADAAGTRGSTTPSAAASSAKSSTYCFRNIKKRFASGSAIPSVNYDDQDSKLASQAADDFTLTQPCLAREVDVLGSFAQGTQLDWETVYIYPDAGGKPGFPAIWVQSALNGKQGDQPGDLRIKFGPVLLQPGTYWISVQAQLAKGSWGWAVTSKQKGSGAVFQNPLGGMVPACPSWTQIQTCFAGTTGTDLLFAVKGK